jgi:hypothetical protein
MATPDDGIQTQIRNIEASYGKPVTEWFAIIAASGRTKHPEVVAMLKNDYGMTHGAAHRVSLLARQAAAPPAPADPTDALYAGAKAGLRPVHDALMDAVRGLAAELEIAPRKGYLSLRRRTQFAMIQPSTRSRIDLGLVLRDVQPEGRLEPAAGFNAMFTHRVRLTDTDDIDTELLGWIRHAYDNAG